MHYHRVRQRPGTCAGRQTPAQPGLAPPAPADRNRAGGFRLDYSRLGIDTVLLSTDQAAIAKTIDGILLPEAYQVGNLRTDDADAMARWRRKVNDVQHLVAHLIAGHDAFVTTDDDMLKKQAELRARTGIVVVGPTEAVQMARGHAA